MRVGARVFVPFNFIYLSYAILKKVRESLLDETEPINGGVDGPRTTTFLRYLKSSVLLAIRNSMNSVSKYLWFYAENQCQIS